MSEFEPPDEQQRDAVKKARGEGGRGAPRGVWVKFDDATGAPIWIRSDQVPGVNSVWCEDPSSLRARLAVLEVELQERTRERDEAKEQQKNGWEHARSVSSELANLRPLLDDARRERDEAKAALEAARAAWDSASDERNSLRSKVAELEAKLVEATKVKAALPFRWRCIECESGSGVFPTEAEAEMAGQEHASTCPARLKLIDQIAAYRLVVADLSRKDGET